MCPPYLSALLPNLLLLSYIQSFLRMSMSRVIRSGDLGAVLGPPSSSLSIGDEGWLLTQHPFLPSPIAHSTQISFGESLPSPCICCVLWVEFTVPLAQAVGSDLLASINIIPSLLPQRLAQKSKPFNVWPCPGPELSSVQSKWSKCRNFVWGLEERKPLFFFLNGVVCKYEVWRSWAHFATMKQASVRIQPIHPGEQSQESHGEEESEPRVFLTEACLKPTLLLDSFNYVREPVFFIVYVSLCWIFWQSKVSLANTLSSNHSLHPVDFASLTYLNFNLPLLSVVSLHHSLDSHYLSYWDSI